MESNEIVQRIERHYIGDGCIQTMVPYRSSITILDKNDAIYHHVEGSSCYINKYLSDERRKCFPYSNIPTHFAKRGLTRLKFTNQIFNFDEPYIIIADGGRIVESFVTKDKDSALLVSKELPITNVRTFYATRAELDKLIEKPQNPNEHLYVMFLRGSWYSDPSEAYISETEILSLFRETLLEQIKDYKKHELDYNNGYRYFSEVNIRCFEHFVENMGISDIPSNIPMDNGDNVIVKVDGSDISIQGISVVFMRPDCYQVTMSDIPVTTYTLEQIKSIGPKILKTKEPKIPLKLNPGVSKVDVIAAKTMIKEFKQSQNR